MMNDTILINTDGDSVGRINGLTILEIGDVRFGMPARITATIYPGSRGVVDIEREAELGQAIHSKGIMILSGYLGHKYATEFPLAISANIALEQSYGYVDGDSAALAEVCALISALTGIPLAQAFAVTGSINQYGEVQTVGGINEKIEGFFRLCEARGLTGRQGVVIPKVNIRNLMLKDDVVDAVRRREFAVHAVNSVDQALELLTGQKAEDINRLAVAKLRQMARHAERKF
jgi:predicted ATP-dependent protease